MLFIGRHLRGTEIQTAVLIISGVFVLIGNPRQLWKGSRIAVSYGLLTGVMIAYHLRQVRGQPVFCLSHFAELWL